jgi:hypothetical protein
MRVVVLGQGYVGLPLAVRAAQTGHDVVGSVRVGNVEPRNSLSSGAAFQFGRVSRLAVSKVEQRRARVSSERRQVRKVRSSLEDRSGGFRRLLPAQGNRVLISRWRPPVVDSLPRRELRARRDLPGACLPRPIPFARCQQPFSGRADRDVSFDARMQMLADLTVNYGKYHREVVTWSGHGSVRMFSANATPLFLPHQEDPLPDRRHPERVQCRPQPPQAVDLNRGGPLRLPTADRGGYATIDAYVRSWPSSGRKVGPRFHSVNGAR